MLLWSHLGVSEGLSDGLALQRLWKNLRFVTDLANASFQYFEPLVGLLGSILASLGPI